MTLINIGDLVVYKNRTSIARYDSIGIVVGIDYDNRAYVLWSTPNKILALDLHQQTALKVLEQG